ncbi:hypothetical protein RF644_07195 [Kocuria sp. CPCC 205258]|uniref:hypothetical protein n=1 Tax=Kocuria sp. CPCC 205258 TaxID=3073552 RepID=UPI0034D7A9D9
MTEQKTDLRGLRAGVRLFVFTTPTAVAVLAVVTDTPAVMILIAVPGAVVGAVLHQERRRITDQPAVGGPVPGPAARPGPGQSITSAPEAPRWTAGRDKRVGEPEWHAGDPRHLLSIPRSSGSHRRVAHWDGAGTPRPHRTSGSVHWSCFATRNETPGDDQHRGTP